MFKPQSTDSVIWSIRDVEFIGPDAERISNLSSHQASYTGIIELRITPCGKLMFTFGNLVTTFATRLELGQWYSHSFSHAGLQTVLYVSGDSSATEEHTNLAITDKIFNEKNNEIWLGSARGSFDFFHGHMSDLYLSTDESNNYISERWGDDNLVPFTGDILGYCQFGYTFNESASTADRFC
jgi:hypothetical protein